MAATTSLSCVFLAAFFLLLSHLHPATAARQVTITQFLNPQNEVRARHGLPLLKWDFKLAKFAKWYANQRRNAVAAWAAEESFYDYKSNQCLRNKDCLHYTQLVWKSIAKVGCAKIICKSGDTFITCNYYPHGNVIGQRPY
ncbi:hypothetical protein AAC387_Pa12g2094 [Persea americana]